MIDEFLLKIKNRRAVVQWAPLVVGSFLGILLIIKPSMTRLFSLQRDIEAISKKTGAYTDILSKEKKLAEYNSRLSPAGDKTKLMDTLNGAASSAGLNISSVTPEENRPVTEYLRQDSVRMDGEGGYHQLGEFISRVENMPDFVKILSVDIFEDASQEGNSAFVSLPWGGPGLAAPAAQPRRNGLHRISVSTGFLSAQIAGQP